MRTQVRMSEPMGARLTRHLASPLVVATPGRVAPWLRVKTAHPEEGREGRRERERERERGETLALRSARKQKGKNNDRTLHSLAAERRRNGKTDEEERREESSRQFKISFFSFFRERRQIRSILMHTI